MIKVEYLEQSPVGFECNDKLAFKIDYSKSVFVELSKVQFATVFVANVTMGDNDDGKDMEVVELTFDTGNSITTIYGDELKRVIQKKRPNEPPTLTYETCPGDWKIPDEDINTYMTPNIPINPLKIDNEIGMVLCNCGDNKLKGIEQC